MKADLLECLRHKIREYVIQLFKDYQGPQLVYHNLEHTLTVVTRAHAIAANYPLNEDEKFILFAAAWFHDTGHLLSEPEKHEEISVEIMKDFFAQSTEISSEKIALIERCILATKIPQSPRTLVEQILCDADIYHIGTDEFEHTNELVYQETILRGGTVDNWWEATVALLTRLHFHTEYCRLKLDAGKARNLESFVDK